MNRLTHAIQSLSLGDYESALLDIVTLIDHSSKTLYGGKKVGRRFRRLLYDKQPLIFWLFTQGQFVTDGHEIHFVSDSGASTTLPDLIYSSLRTALVHEAQLPKDIRITVDPGATWRVGYENGVFLFPRSLVAALLLMLISLPFNIRYKEFTALTLHLPAGVNVEIADVWGNEQLIIARFEKVFGKTYKAPPPHRHTPHVP